MTDYCLFTITHPDAKRIYIRGVADITEPVDEYEKIIEFYDDNELKNSPPSNPYEVGSEDYKLFEELLSVLRKYLENIGDDLVFAASIDDERAKWNNRAEWQGVYIIDMEKISIDD